MQPTRDTRQLNWFLAWAVVFCDIGTSVYYVPGIMYGHVKDATPFFVLLTTGGFILLSLKYIEISWRNPEGGGVVTITSKAFGPIWGCLGGMLITVDYFLTTAISAVSGFQYLGSAFPILDAHIVLLPVPASACWRLNLSVFAKAPPSRWSWPARLLSSTYRHGRAFLHHDRRQWSTVIADSASHKASHPIN